MVEGADLSLSHESALEMLLESKPPARTPGVFFVSDSTKNDPLGGPP